MVRHWRPLPLDHPAGPGFLYRFCQPRLPRLSCVEKQFQCTAIQLVHEMTLFTEIMYGLSCASVQQVVQAVDIRLKLFSGVTANTGEQGLDLFIAVPLEPVGR